jgi:hypothetical protein
MGTPINMNYTHSTVHSKQFSPSNTENPRPKWLLKISHSAFFHRGFLYSQLDALLLVHPILYLLLLSPSRYGARFEPMVYFAAGRYANVPFLLTLATPQTLFIYVSPMHSYTLPIISYCLTVYTYLQ